MKHRQKFSEWIVKRNIMINAAQLLCSLQLDECSHFMIETMPIASGKTWILKQFEEYVKEQQRSK